MPESIEETGDDWADLPALRRSALPQVPVKVAGRTKELSIDKKNSSSKDPNEEKLFRIAEVFKKAGSIVDVRAYGNGNVNDTFRVTLEAADQRYFILQRINTRVFAQPRLIMRNMCLVTEHIAARLLRHSTPAGRPWKVPHVILTRDGMDHWLHSEGSLWRAIDFIDGAQSFDTVQHIDHAREVGFALGFFHHLISDIPSQSLADTLVGFHITPLYLERYEAVLSSAQTRESPEVTYCTRLISERRALAPVLEDAREHGKLTLRPIHGDPKINNVMIDRVTGRAVSLIDLDTVKPGLIHYDIGDCLRSCCNPAGEETEQWETVRFDLDCCQAILRGYCAVADSFLTRNDYDYIYEAVRLIAFELGLRFFTDYLQGNVYFKVRHDLHNLQRALVQFKLAESIERQAGEIRAIVEALR